MASANIARAIGPYVQIGEKERSDAEARQRKYAKEADTIMFRLVYCEDFPVRLVASVRDMYEQPRLCRDGYSAVTWRPEEVLSAEQLLELSEEPLALTDIYSCLGISVLQGMLDALQHLQAHRSGSRGMGRKYHACEGSLVDLLERLTLSGTDTRNESLAMPARQTVAAYIAAYVKDVSQTWELFSSYVCNPSAADEFAPVVLKPGF